MIKNTYLYTLVLGGIILFTAMKPTSSVSVAREDILQESQQLLVVYTNGWEEIQGKMQRFVKNPNGKWIAIGDVIPICVGKNGLGWGIGLYPSGADKGVQSKADKAPRKREGDNKAPAGIFNISALFTKDADLAHTYLMPVFTIKPTTEAVDDPKSRYYNQIIDEALIGVKDWDSSEKMYEIDLYTLGAVIDHNIPVQDTQAGSCIFMHEWRRPEGPTAGCTAMAKDDLERVCQWLDIKQKPLLVQLPLHEYNSLRKQLQELPPISDI
jgi:hypothetical protein